MTAATDHALQRAIARWILSTDYHNRTLHGAKPMPADTDTRPLGAVEASIDERITHHRARAASELQLAGTLSASMLTQREPALRLAQMHQAIVGELEALRDELLNPETRPF